MKIKASKEEIIETQSKDIIEKFKIDDLISSVFKDKSKKPEIIEKLRLV